VEGSYHLNYGREIVAAWARDHIERNAGRTVRILDAGAGRGEDLVRIREAAREWKIDLYGIECNPANAESARGREIVVYESDIEREEIPAPDRSFDIVIANQILEHTKEIFWIFSEFSRVLREGGICVVGVPNLAAWHNRGFLLFGLQPTCIEVMGPHVRGMTKGGFREFATCDGYFECLAVKGANFYPFPPFLSRPLARIFPSLSVCLFFLLRRTAKAGRFIEVLDTRGYETSYFRGRTCGAA
jgi:SAM-dependent methyltransferase